MSKYQHDPNQVAIMGMKTHFVKWIKDEDGDEYLIAVCSPGGKAVSRILFDKYGLHWFSPGPPTCKKCLHLKHSNTPVNPKPKVKAVSTVNKNVCVTYCLSCRRAPVNAS